MSLDPKRFKGDLRKAIETWQRMKAEYEQQIIAVDAARESVRAAKAEDLNTNVEYRLKGKRIPDGELQETIAQQTLKSENRELEAAERAMLASQDRLAEEAVRADHFATEEEAAVAAALNMLTSLEEALGKVAEVRSLKKWCAKPVSANRVAEPHGRTDVWLGNAALKANGEPCTSNEMTQPLRVALEGTAPNPNPASEYGMPVGAVLTGPWGVVEPMKNVLSSSARNLFDEEAAEAAEAQAVLTNRGSTDAPVA